MQQAVGGPLPPPEQSPGQAPGPAPIPVAGPAGGPGPGPAPGVAPGSAAGSAAGPGAHPQVPPAPPQPAPYPAPTAGSRLGVHPMLQAGAPRPPHPAPPAPGWGAPGAVPQHSSPQPHRADLTGHVPLPPVSMPLAPPVEYGGGTGAATLAVLLIGPAGAGKTTVARHWAQRRRVPTAHISLDDVREWVCSGFADPQSGWNEHSEAQYRLARRTCGFAARNFLANGISCIVDDAVFPDRPVVGLGGWKRHVGPGLLPVVLLPGLEIVLERNAERSGNRRLSDEEVAAIHGRMAGWYGSGLPIIDNSTYDVETTARVLDDVLARAIASPPAW
ncbi:AAA family ATPase [Streptomyces sp. NBC_00094]|uniref:AAA family ATPase n=1 Tax=Streptomyces sp. NBC_00094 TaxID=2903620 RepID=UPI002252B9F4|nr:AAA family ATPase [Streptomyces sp. NBC_00094]MCX5389538.1 ATP-binding protein [Streptomyces sp. NBC_00094]